MSATVCGTVSLHYTQILATHLYLSLTCRILFVAYLSHPQHRILFLFARSLEMCSCKSSHFFHLYSLLYDARTVVPFATLFHIALVRVVVTPIMMCDFTNDFRITLRSLLTGLLR